MLYLSAPPGKFRVVCVDTFDGTDWVHGDFDTLDQARTEAERNGATMLKTHVYDDTGKHWAEYGTF